jgi:hypothetical protein
VQTAQTGAGGAEAARPITGKLRAVYLPILRSDLRLAVAGAATATGRHKLFVILAVNTAAPPTNALICREECVGSEAALHRRAGLDAALLLG